MTGYKATPEQWIDVEFGDKDDFHSACVLELRARIEQLEAQASSQKVADPAPVAGEVEELVADLRTMATHAAAACQPGDFKILTRAANILQQIGEQEAGR